MDNRVDRVRKMLAMQETLDHDKNSASWRGRLGWDLEEEKTAKQKEKSAALEKSKQLTNSGKHKDCLLYTSPSPRDRTRSRMPSSA